MCLGKSPWFLLTATSATACARPAGVRDLAPGGRRERLQQAHHLHQPLPLAQALLLVHQPARPPAVQGGLLRGTSSCHRSPLAGSLPSPSWTVRCAERCSVDAGHGAMLGRRGARCCRSAMSTLRAPHRVLLHQVLFSRRSPAGRCTPSACGSPRARARVRRRS